MHLKNTGGPAVMVWGWIAVGEKHECSTVFPGSKSNEASIVYHDGGVGDGG